MTTPTMNKMLKAYLESASVERLKCGRPNEGTVQNTLVGYRRFMRWMNDRRERCGHDRMALDEDFPLVSIIKPPLIHKYLSDMLKDGSRPAQHRQRPSHGLDLKEAGNARKMRFPAFDFLLSPQSARRHLDTGCKPKV